MIYLQNDKSIALHAWMVEKMTLSVINEYCKKLPDDLVVTWSNTLVKVLYLIILIFHPAARLKCTYKHTVLV